MVTCNTFCDPGVLTQTLSYFGGGLDTGIISVNFSSIFGGQNNTVTGNCSAIFCGSGNSDGGFSNVFIAGSGITGIVNNAFHTEEIVLTNIAVANSLPSYLLLQPGQLYTSCAPNSGFLCSPIFIV